MAAAGNTDHWLSNGPDSSLSFVAEDTSAAGTSEAAADMPTDTGQGETTTSPEKPEEPQPPQKAEPVLADTTGPPLEVGVCGLRNLGNTCYMNAGLQSLCAVGHFREAFLNCPLLPSLPLDLKDSKDTPKPWLQEQLAVHLSSLLRKAWSGAYRCVQPKTLRLLVGALYQPFSSSRQQDAQEFLAILLDALRDLQTRGSYPSKGAGPGSSGEVHQAKSQPSVELMETSQQGSSGSHGNTSGDHTPSNHTPDIKPTAEHVAREGQSSEAVARQQQAPAEESSEQGSREVVKDDLSTLSSIVTDTFQGTLRNEIVCSSCSFSSTKREPFMFLSLPIPRALEVPLEVVWTSPKQVSQRVLLTLLQHQTYREVKLALIEALQLPVGQRNIVLFESSNYHVGRKLVDNMGIRSRDKQTELVGSLLPIEEENPGDSERAESRVVVQWHTCAVCLEEVEDHLLLVHPACSGTLCSPCLKMALEHSKVCAVCQVPVQDEDFVPMATDVSASSDTTRLLQVCLLFRREGGKSSESSVAMELLSYPVILNLTTPTPGEALYRQVEENVPLALAGRPFTLHTTGFMGRYCSRCEFGAKCGGCVIPPGPAPFTLKAGDFIALTVTADDETAHQVKAVLDHPSMKNRHSNNISLEECIEAFSKIELLGTDNPWYCPGCERTSPAQRTLDVQALPKCLIIQLKRFFFQNNFSCKVDSPVGIPLVLQGGVFKDDSAKLHLRSCVCHSGSLSGGHYTSYVRHPTSDRWYYCNDETVTETEPGMVSPEEAYILMYEREGEAAPPRGNPLPGLDFTWDDEVAMSLIKWLDPPTSSVVYGPSLPRSYSDTKLSEAKESKVSFLDDFNLRKPVVGDFPPAQSQLPSLARRSLDDITGGVVLRSFKVEGVEVYRARDV